MHVTGAETITGAKTFTVAPVVPSASFPESATVNLVSDLASKAADSLTCHLAGAETITGAKTFSANITANQNMTFAGNANVALIQLPKAGRIAFGTDESGASNTANGQAIMIGPVDPNNYAAGPAGQSYNFGGNATIIGAGAMVYAGSSADNNLAIGSVATVLSNPNGTISTGGFRNTVIGAQYAAAEGYRNIAIGNGANASGANNVCIGDYGIIGDPNGVSGGSPPTYGLHQVQSSVAIGKTAKSNNNFSVALGANANTTADHQVMLGTAAEDVKHPGTASFTGVATFATAPVVPSASFPEAAVTNLITDLAAKATDSLTCHLAGAETITGAKTFSAAPTMPLGTAGTVSIGRNGNCGIYWPSNTTLGFSTAGVAAGSIDGSQQWLFTPGGVANGLVVNKDTGSFPIVAVGATPVAGQTLIVQGQGGSGNILQLNNSSASNVMSFGQSGTLTSSGRWRTTIDGTAVLPAVTLSNASQIGLYAPGTNILGFATSGVAAGQVDASQNWTLNGNNQFGAATTNYHGVDTAPVAGQTLTVKGATADGSTYALWATDSAGTRVGSIRNNGEIFANGSISINAGGSASSMALKLNNNSAGLYSTTTQTLGFATAAVSAGLVDASQNWTLGNAGNYVQVGSGTADGAGVLYLGTQGNANAVKLYKYGAGGSLYILSGSGSPGSVFSGTYSFGGGTAGQLSSPATNVVLVGSGSVPASLMAGIHTIAKTSNYTIPTGGTENGSHYTTTGAAGAVQFTVTPAAEVFYRFTATAAQTMTVVAASGSLLGPNLTGATRTISAGTAANQYSSFDLACDATNCYVRGISGTVN